MPSLGYKDFDKLIPVNAGSHIVANVNMKQIYKYLYVELFYKKWQLTELFVKYTVG